MVTADRIDFLASILATFMGRAHDRGLITVGVLGKTDEFVQYQLRGERLCGEVGSRRWAEPERPLPPHAVAALAGVGFTGGGPERNFAADNLTRSPAELARLTDALLRAAYDLSEDFDPVVSQMDLHDRTLPRATPFTRDMIETHLRAHEVRFLRDQDGDFRVELADPDRQGNATVWLIAQDDGDTVFHIQGAFESSALAGDRTQALELCNTWNREHCWPSAFLLDREGSWRFSFAAHLGLEAGVHQDLFEEFTCGVMQGIFQLWQHLATATPADPQTAPRRRRRRPKTGD